MSTFNTVAGQADRRPNQQSPSSSVGRVGSPEGRKATNPFFASLTLFHQYRRPTSSPKTVQFPAGTSSRPKSSKYGPGLTRSTKGRKIPGFRLCP